jgi:2-keto-3-deoxy-6-phosphogluconate aldolase
VSRLLRAYRTLYEQAFVPIFAVDSFDSRMLLEACVEAGLGVVEYTLRRSDADRMIPWIRERYPELILLVGSTLDDEEMVRRARRRHPQLLTLGELASIGVDGFVSMVGLTVESIRRYAGTHLLLPTATTLREAFEQSAAGAQFTKLLGPDLGLTRLCANPGAYGFTPVFMTGGMNAEQLPAAFAGGVHVAGAGFELLLGARSAPPTRADVVAVVRHHVEVAQRAQQAKWPALARARGADDRTWLEALPHNHPFSPA